MFGYLCQECGKGTVKPVRVKNYRTKFSGYPFIVEEAFIGQCNVCGAEHFSASELKRWKKLFKASLESNGQLLTQKEIVELREQLGLSRENFALLIGCSLRSLNDWESPTLQTPPERIADLMMRLLRESLSVGKVNVLEFLLAQASRVGAEIKVNSNRSLPSR